MSEAPAKRRWRRYVVRAALLVLTVFALGLVFLHTAAGGAWLLDFVESHFLKDGGISLRARSVRFSPFTLQLVMEKVELKVSKPSGGQSHTLSADRFVADMSWSSLFGRTIHFQKIVIVGPRFEGGAASPSPAENTSSSEMGEGKNLRIDHLELNGGAMDTRNWLSGIRLQLNKLSLNIRYDELEKAHRGSLKLGGGKLATSDHSWDLTRGTLSAVFDGRKLTVDRLLLERDASRLQARGSMTLLGAPLQYEADVDLSLRMEDWLNAWMPDLAVTGEMSLSGSLRSEGSESIFTGRVETRDGRVGKSGPFFLSGLLSGGFESMDLSELHLQTEAGEGRGDLHLNFLGEESRLSLIVSRIALNQLTPFFPSEFPVLASLASGQLDVAWTSPVLEELTTRIDLQLTGDPQYVPVSGRLHLYPLGRVELRSDSGKGKVFSELSFPEGQVTIRGEWDEKRFYRAEMSAGTAHWTALRRKLGAGSSPLIPSRIDEGEVRLVARGNPKAVHFDARYDIRGFAWSGADLPGQKAHGEIAANWSAEGWRGEYKTHADFLPNSLTLNNIALSGRFRNRELMVDVLDLNAEQGSLTGSLALNGDKRSFRALLKGQKLPLSLIRPFIANSGELQGTADFSLEGQGTAEKPGFNLEMQLGDVIFKGQRFSLVELDAISDRNRAEATVRIPSLGLHSHAVVALEAPYLVLGELTVAQPALSIGFSYPIQNPAGAELGGRFALDSQNLPALVLDRWPELKELSGKLSCRFKVKGNPKIPQSLKADLEIDPMDLDFAGRHIVLPHLSKFSLRENRVGIEPLIIQYSGAKVNAAGSVLLKADPVLDLKMDIGADLDHLTEGLTFGRMNGSLQINGVLVGPLSELGIDGRGRIRDLSLRLRDVPLALSGVNGEFVFDRQETRISELKGVANGGTVVVAGRIAHREALPPAADSLHMVLRQFAVTSPEGLRMRVDADLVLNGSAEKPVLEGEIRMLRGSYRRDIYPGVELLNLARYVPPPTPEDIPELLRDLQFDLRLNSAETLRVRNNLADMELESHLVITGTPAFPLLSGRVQNRHSGQLTLGGRNYSVEKLLIEYAGSAYTDFMIDLIAHTRVRYRGEDIDIRLQLLGPGSKPEYILSHTWTNQTAKLSNQDLAFLLLTGKLPSDLSGSALDTLGGQILTHFSTPFTSPLTEGLKKLLKAEDVLIEPLLIAAETDPGARFTFRKRVSNQVLFTYSADITRNQRHTWMLDYDLLPSLSIGLFSRDDGSYGASFKHVFRFGGHSPPADSSVHRSGEGGRIGSLTWSGDWRLSGDLLKKLSHRLDPGRPFSYSELYSVVRDTLAACRRSGYIDATVTPRFQPDAQGLVDIDLHVRSGGLVRFEFAGDPISGQLKDQIREAWLGDFPEESNQEEARQLIRTWLRKKRFLDATVKISKEVQGDRVSHHVHVTKGLRYRIVDLFLEGSCPLSLSELKRTLRSYAYAPTRSLWNLVLDESNALAAVRRQLADSGYLKAFISPPKQVRIPGTDRIQLFLNLRSGPRFTVHEVRLNGCSALLEDKVNGILELRLGMAFSPSRLAEDRNRILTFYRSQGYGDVDVRVESIPHADENELDLSFIINEGRLHRVSSIEIKGNRRTNAAFIRREAALIKGAPITIETLAKSRKRLYNSGSFSNVNITRQPTLRDGQERDDILIEVVEAPLFNAAYGVRYNSEEKMEGQGELSFANLLGGGRRGFLSYRQNRRQTDLRFSLSAPYLFSAKVESLLALYYQKEEHAGFVSTTRGITLQQNIRLPLDFSLAYLYRYNRIHTYEYESSGPFPFDFTVNLSEIGVSILRDRRDDRLNPRSGSYLSASLTYSPAFLGTDLPYISFFGQFTQLVTVRRGLIWAGSLRLGLADAFDQDLIPSKRFFAGGSTSVRGFSLDALGPRDPYLDRAAGGESVLILNSELRFNLMGKLGAVLFYDLGNAFATARDMALSDLRHGAGFGLRYDSPLGLIRLDLGFNVKPRPGEGASALFFSIGQAF